MTQELSILGELKAEMKHLAHSFHDQRKVQDDRWNKIEPVLLERSGDQVKASEMRSDVNNLGQKIRTLTARIEKLEAWKDRTLWIGLGGFAVIQFIFMVVGPRLMRLLGI